MAITLFCSVMFSFSATPFYAADALSGSCGASGADVNWSYNTSTKTLTITGTGAIKDFGIIAIGSLANVAPWKAYRSTCTDVVIGEGITAIGNYSFYEMTAMTDISLPSTLTTINKRAFENATALQYIDLNEGLLTIEQAAFKGCTALKEIIFPDSLTSIGGGQTLEAGYGVFQNCTALETVVFGNGLTSTGAYSFYEAGVKNITFSESITTVDRWCFFKCPMEEVKLPENITNLETRCFADCTNMKHAFVYNAECDFGGLNIEGAKDPFNGSQQTLTFHGYAPSTAQTYANEKGYQFVTFDDSCAHPETHQVTVIEPTCDTVGKANVICDICGKLVQTVDIPANGHDYINLTEVVDTTAVDGHSYVDQECTVCGATHREYTHNSWVDGYYTSTTTATCQRAGLRTDTCSVCGQTRTLPSLRTDHNVEVYTSITEPTCTVDGEKTGICTMCGKTVTVTLPATGHTEELTSTENSADGSHTYNSYACSVCGETREETVHNEWVEGQYTEVEISPVGCTSNGQVERTCSVCGRVEIFTTQMTGHNYNYEYENGELTGGEITKEPTCTETGTRTFTCANCGNTISYPIRALGHSYDSQTVLREPTCTVSGTGADVCSRCGSMSAYEIPALGHDISEAADYEVISEPTCVDEGSAQGTCTRCNEYVTVVLETAGHSFDEENAVQTKAPTCTTDGKATATCTVCGATETIAIPATGHHYHYYRHEDGNLGRTIVYKCEDCTDKDSTLVTALATTIPVYLGTKVEDARITSAYRYDVDEDGFITMRDYSIIKEYIQLGS